MKKLKHDQIDFEIILAVGTNPSYQRNTLANTAKGDFILFLDDDSLPTEDLLERYYETIQNDSGIEIIGGPSLLLKTSNYLYPLSQIYFSSLFGIGHIRSRYNSLGLRRKGTERDLILCNLLIKKDFFLKTKGFNQDIYPGEENEFIKKLHLSSQIIHDPEAVVYREARETLYLFLQQMYSYGKGRSKHLEFNFLPDYVFLIPMVFFIYFFILPFYLSKIFAIPLFLHFSLSLLTLFFQNNPKLKMTQKISLPLFFLLGHLSYGLGSVVGMIKYKILKKILISKRNIGPIEVYQIKSFKKNST